MKILEKQLELTKKGTQYVLLSVVETGGDSPYEVGEKMILLEDGDTFGDIGNSETGVLQDIKEDALENMIFGKAYSKEYARSSTVRKVLRTEPETVAEQEEEPTEDFGSFRFLEDTESFSKTDGIGGGFSTFGMLDDDHAAPVEPETEDEAPLEAEDPSNYVEEEFGGSFSVKIFAEYYIPAPHLVVCGGGAVGSAILELGKFLNLGTTLIDTRSQISAGDSARFADKFVHCDDYEEGIRSAELFDNAYFVLDASATAQQWQAVEGLVKCSYRYAGILGDANEAVEIFSQLGDRDIPKKKLDRIHVPTGLEISNGRPEESALAVMAEILAIKNNRV